MKYVVHTFGCQMNVHDSDRMDAVLKGHGWTAATQIEDADLIVFNTCSVREKAEQKLRSEVGKLAPLKKLRPELIVVVAGCLAQQEGEKLLARSPLIDLVLGPDNLGELPRLALDQMSGAAPRAVAEFDLDAPHFLPIAPEAGQAPVSALVTTMKGCDERCSFCIVPTTRGPERYRPAQQIIEEVQKWVDAGAREVTLLGQTVDSFRDPSLPPPDSDDPDESQFPHLLRAIAMRVPELLRLRYTSPHPRHATASLARAHAELDVLARHVHLPVQSGSDRMLRRMIRRYTRAEYIERARRILAAQPGMTLSTDIIVGFPGETDEDFEATLSLVREVGFTALFGFKFSPRPGTPALKLMKDDVPEDVKSARLAQLFATVEAQGEAHLASLIGSRQHVLIEGLSKTQLSRDATDPNAPPTWQGRSRQNEIVHLQAFLLPNGQSPAMTGAEIEVDILRANRHSLEGRMTDEAREKLPNDVHAAPRPPTRKRALPLIRPERPEHQDSVVAVEN